MPDAFYKDDKPQQSTAKKPPASRESVKVNSNPNKIEEEDDESGENLISDKRLDKDERENYKNSFLTKLFDNFEFQDDKQ